MQPGQWQQWQLGETIAAKINNSITYDFSLRCLRLLRFADGGALCRLQSGSEVTLITVAEIGLMPGFKNTILPKWVTKVDPADGKPGGLRMEPAAAKRLEESRMCFVFEVLLGEGKHLEVNVCRPNGEAALRINIRSRFIGNLEIVEFTLQPSDGVTVDLRNRTTKLI